MKTLAFIITLLCISVVTTIAYHVTRADWVHYRKAYRSDGDKNTLTMRRYFHYKN